MPAIYAHYRFGSMVYEKLPSERKKQITHKDLFDIGLSGPDFFFYYLPVKKCKINQIGYDVHYMKGSEFFRRAKYQKQFVNDPDAYFSYLCGILCHYVLDLSCHSYIEKKIQTDGVSHTDIEADFERYLLLLDGFNPIEHHSVDHFKVNKKNAEVISAFFPESTSNEVLKSLLWMVSLERLFFADKSWKRNLLYRLFHLFHCDDMKNHVMPDSSLDLCQDSNLRLEKLLNKAVPLAIDMLEELIAFIYDNKPLSSRFTPTFEAEDWQTIPILSYQEELTYEP